MSHQEDSIAKHNNSAMDPFALIPTKESTSVCETKSILERLGCAELSTMVTSERSPIIHHPVSISELEMLEAELLNQGIVSEHGEPLHKLAQKDICSLKWSVRNHRGNGVPLEFRVDLVKFIITKVSDFLQNSDLSLGLAVDSVQGKNINYFNQIAAYLNGGFSKPTSAYERAQNLILQSIISGAGTFSERAKVSKSNVVILPQNKKELSAYLDGLK